MFATSSANGRVATKERSGMRILFLVHRTPFPPDKGDRIRSYHLLSKLSELGRVDLAFLTEDQIDKASLARLGRFCRRVEAIPVPKARRWVNAALCLAAGRSLTEGLFKAPAMRALLDRWLNETPYDAVVCFSSGVLPYLLERDLEQRLIVDMVDADSQKWFDYAARTRGPKAALFRLEGRRVRDLERAAECCRTVVFAAEPEAVLYQRFAPRARVETILNGVDLDYFQASYATESTGGCVFVGQLDYRANVLGLEWFCREAWPLVRAALPQAKLRVVGRNPVAAVQRLGSIAGVEIIGTVPDVRPHLAAARLAVVPLPVARGVQNKVLEAMAMGLPVVASSAALEGLPLTPGRDALAADDPSAWARIVADLWDDPARRLDLGRNARRYVEIHHSWDARLSRFDELVESPSGAISERGA